MFEFITTHTKYYFVRHANGRIPQTIRRDVYWDNGFKSPAELKLIEQVEAQFEENAVPCLYLLEEAE